MMVPSASRTPSTCPAPTESLDTHVDSQVDASAAVDVGHDAPHLGPDGALERDR